METKPTPKKWSAFAIVLLFAAVALPRPSHACSCIPPRPAQEELGRAQAVFAGKVVSVKPHWNIPPGSRPADNDVRMEVIESWKGVDSRAVSVATAPQSAACGFDFQVGQEYLVYAQDASSEGRTLVTSLCSRTKLLSQAQEDLMVLGEGKPAVKDPSGQAAAGVRQTAAVVLVGALFVAALGYVIVRRSKRK